MYIYKTINLLNGKIYIGQSKFNPDENPEYLGSGYILLRAIKCYGQKNFKKEIIEICDTKEALCERERYWINTLKANVKGIGYNICEGGAWGDTFTNNPRAEEIRAVFRVLNGGSRNPNFGNRWSQEQRQKAADRCIKRQAMIDKKTGLNIAKLPDVRKKISESKMGLKNPNAYLWKLTSPIGDVFMIEGGINYKLKEYGVDYQQFRFQIDPHTRKNKTGWILTKIPKSDIEAS